MSDSKDCGSRDHLKVEDFDAAAKFLTLNVFPGYDGLKEKLECQPCVEFLDYGTENTKHTVFSTFLHTYIANPPPNLRSQTHLDEIGQKFSRIPSFLTKLEEIDYDPLQEVHKIAMYLTFLAFMRPQHSGSNVPSFYRRLLLFLNSITGRWVLQESEISSRFWESNQRIHHDRERQI